MNNAEKVMLSIIDNKIDHAQDFMDQGDYESATQAHEEVQDFIRYLYAGKLKNVQVNTKQEESDLFDSIVTRKLL